MYLQSTLTTPLLTLEHVILRQRRFILQLITAADVHSITPSSSSSPPTCSRQQRQRDLYHSLTLVHRACTGLHVSSMLDGSLALPQPPLSSHLSLVPGRRFHVSTSMLLENPKYSSRILQEQEPLANPQMKVPSPHTPVLSRQSTSISIIRTPSLSSTHPTLYLPLISPTKRGAFSMLIKTMPSCCIQASQLPHTPLLQSSIPPKVGGRSSSGPAKRSIRISSLLFAPTSSEDATVPQVHLP